MKYTLDNALENSGKMSPVLDQEIELVDGGFGPGAALLIACMITGAVKTYLNNHY